ncbi:MAG TPA: FAD-dependent oxidoreductase [Gemmatimonadales bacterium]|nr:FAD-dependent oxidoreductase [Gemmatimonadales bacterium]
MITADLIRHISLFSKVPEDERISLAARAADLRLRKDEWLLVEGQNAGFYGLLEGHIDVLKIVDGQEHRLTTYGPGDSFGEVPLLLGSPAIANLRATEPCRVLRLEGADFLQLVSQCQVLSSEITKTMAARVKHLSQFQVEHPRGVVTVIGDARDAACFDLRDFLLRNGVAFVWQEPNGSSPADQEARVTPTAVVLPDGRRLEAPTFRGLAEALGLQTQPKHRAYDAVIVGGGIGGLAAAVYGASEGLRTLSVERLAYGGQAGTSSRIENYLGFPVGIGGDELSARARRQALRFGAELLVPRTVARLEPGDPRAEGPSHTIVLDDETRIQARTVILATGVDWRRLSVPGIERLVGHGVYYGAAKAEALKMQGLDVHLVGGGNSAGQAALLFADYARSVTMLVRGQSLAASMSRYLIDQLEQQHNVTVETGVQVTGVEGKESLEAIEVTSDKGRRRERRASDALFVLIGGEAQTAWLPDAVIRDQWGYICTGRDVMDLLRERPPTTWPLERDPFLLETSVPGILAAGDVRHGSIKRCSAAVGEGSMAIAVVHHVLAELETRGERAEVGGGAGQSAVS